MKEVGSMFQAMQWTVAGRGPVFQLTSQRTPVEILATIRRLRWERDANAGSSSERTPQFIRSDDAYEPLPWAY